MCPAASSTTCATDSPWADRRGQPTYWYLNVAQLPTVEQIRDQDLLPGQCQQRLTDAPHAAKRLVDEAEVFRNDVELAAADPTGLEPIGNLRAAFSRDTALHDVPHEASSASLWLSRLYDDLRSLKATGDPPPL